MASSNKSGFKITTVGVSIRLFILVIVIFFFQSVDTVFAQFEYDFIILYRYDYDQNKCSYHFSEKSFGEASDGEFYFFTGGKFHSNAIGQRGLIDLGSSVQFDPLKIEIPSTGYDRMGLEAIPLHVYLSLARKGEESRYILFRVNYLSIQGKAVGLEYYILDTGTIVVKTNVKGGFSIHGPRKFTGEGIYWQKERALTGTYTIIFDPISGYETPSSQDKLLGLGETVVFEGNYERESAATITGIVTDAKTGDPIGGATVTVDGEQTATGSGGSFSLSVDAGSYTVTVSKQGYQTDKRDVTVNPGEAKNILVTLSGAPATITGSVTDAKTGEPIGGATVTVDGEQASTDSGGSFSLSVDAGSYTVTVSKQGYQIDTRSVTVDPGETKNILVTLSGARARLSIDTTPVKGTVLVNWISWGIAPVSQEVEIGTYTITFGDVDDYTTPYQQIVAVEAGLTTDVMVTYIEKTEPEPEPEPPEPPIIDITQVILALIGLVGTIFTVYFGYRTVIARLQKT